MTDRELLELAANAAGYELDWYPSTRCDLVTKRSVGEVVKLDWNPLTNDGDALRLVVKCNLHVCVGYGSVSACLQDDGSFHQIEETKNDPYAATRRAIVRSAAEIGRSMK